VDDDLASVDVYYNGGTLLGSATVDSGNWSFTTAPLADGNYSFAVVVTDAAGNMTYTSAVPATVDTTASAPSLSLATDSGSSNSDKITNNGRVNVSGLEAGAAWQYSIDGGANWTTGSGASFTLAGDGAKSVTVRQTDSAGNVSPDSGPFGFTLDTTGPSETISSTIVTDSGQAPTIGFAGVTNDNTLGLSGTVDDDLASVDVYYNGGTLLGSATVDSGNWSFTTAPLADGNYSFAVVVTDAAGNMTYTSAVPATVDTTASAPSLSLATDSGSSNSDTENTVVGGAGADVLTGGSGADRFVFNAISDSSPDAPDVITDFVHGTDTIDLSAIDADTSSSGDQAFTNLIQSMSVFDHDVSWFESNGNTIVQADVNGNTTADLTIVLTGTNLNLSTTDFRL
jgi:hypothetical protein